MIDISVTIRDIARKCGVSEGTVDRALNNRDGIKKETKENILETAKQLNYQPNHLARCLAKGSTKTIGVVCAGLGNTFFTSLIESIEQMANENGYFINLMLTHNSVERELEGIKYLVNRQVDGILIFPIGQDEEYIEELKKVKVPIVTIYNRISPDFVHVDVDCRQIMRNAVSYIASKGYKRIAYMDIDYRESQKEKHNRFSLDQRYFGYKEGVEKEKLGEKIVFDKFCLEEIMGFINKGNGKPAILCAFDNMAIGLLDLLKNHGVLVPEEVGIMGFDNIPMLDLISPRLNSVDCGIRTIGREAVSMMLQSIKGEGVHDQVTGYTFTEGKSL